MTQEAEVDCLAGVKKCAAKGSGAFYAWVKAIVMVVFIHPTVDKMSHRQRQ